MLVLMFMRMLVLMFVLMCQLTGMLVVMSVRVLFMAVHRCNPGRELFPCHWRLIMTVILARDMDIKLRAGDARFDGFCDVKVIALDPQPVECVLQSVGIDS